MPFKTNGLYLGHSPTLLRWRKTFYVSEGVAGVEWLPDQQTWALEEDVHIHPVSIIEAYPEGGSPQLGFQRALQMIDGVPDVEVVRHSHLGVPEAYLVGPIKDPPVQHESFRPLRLISNEEGPGAYVAPDDIFSQCGIQFRLASYVAIEVPIEVYEGRIRRVDPGFVADPTAKCDPDVVLPADRPDGDGAKTCVLDKFEWEEIFGSTSCNVPPSADPRGDAIETIIEMAKSETRLNMISGLQEEGDFEGLDIVLMGAIGTGLCPGDLFGLTKPGSWSAVGTDLAGAEPTTLAHEMGHDLLRNDDHVDFPDNGAVDLMKAGGGDGFHIPGCQTWQHDFVGLPVGCDANANASVEGRNLCEEMRSASPPAARPIDMEPGAPSDFLQRRWTYGRFTWGGAIAAQFTDVRASEGANSIVVPVGYKEIASPAFRPADLAEVGDRLSLDIFVPSPVANPYWVGSAAVFVDIPSAGIHNQWIAQVDLTPLSRGVWSTAEFSLPAGVVNALRTDLPAAQIIVAMNTGTSGLLIDGLRFSAQVQPQTIEHVEGSSADEIALLPGGGFEQAVDWTVSPSTGVVLKTQTILQGAAALAVPSGGNRLVTSRVFNTSELGGVTDVLSLDVFVPSPQPNPWWVGQVQVFASCPSAGVYDQWLGQEALTNLFTDEYNQLLFDVPAIVRDAWDESHSDCTVSISLDTNSGSGAFLFDRLGFF